MAIFRNLGLGGGLKTPSQASEVSGFTYQNPNPGMPNLAEVFGQVNNDVSGVSSTQDWQKEMRDTSILSQAHQYEQLGLNPSLLYGQGASAASTPASGTGNLSLAGLINSATGIVNAATHHYDVDRRNRHLDWKEKDAIDRTVIEVFDKLGNLVRSSASTRTFTK